jgi:hypothetical protein
MREREQGGTTPPHAINQTAMHQNRSTPVFI